MQSTGHGSRHLSQPEHNSGRMITSIPWLKIAPKLGGQARKQASQLMHSDISIYIGAFGHFGLRKRFSIRDNLAALFPDAIKRILRGDIDHQLATTQTSEVILERAPTEIPAIRVAT